MTDRRARSSYELDGLRYTKAMARRSERITIGQELRARSETPQDVSDEMLTLLKHMNAPHEEEWRGCLSWQPCADARKRVVNTRTYKREAPEDRASNRKDERDALNERAMVSLGPLGHRNNARRLDWFSVVPRAAAIQGRSALSSFCKLSVAGSTRWLRPQEAHETGMQGFSPGAASSACAWTM
jgi:hypothetical protein